MKERTTVFQVIDNNGNVIHSSKYLCKCRKYARKHFTLSEQSGKGSWIEICHKVTLSNKCSDHFRKYFPKFESKSNGLFRRYVLQHIVIPKHPRAEFEHKCVAYIINSFHENHLEK